MIIKYASAPCGSGKTYNLVKRACNLARRGRRVIIGQPTRDLIDKTVEEELGSRHSPPPYKVLHGGTVGEGSVAKAIVQLFKQPSTTQIVFTTHAALPVVPYWENASDWDVGGRRACRLPA
jgi:superfamily II DNA or RNA helicase